MNRSVLATSLGGLLALATACAESGAPTAMDASVSTSPTTSDPDATTCEPSLSKCGAACLNLKTDIAHCGDCFTVCSAPAGGAPPSPVVNEAGSDAEPPIDLGQRVATATCNAGQCGFACPEGSTACGGLGCFDLSIRHDRCGSCDTSCHPDEECSSGTCCTKGKSACDNVCFELAFSPYHCGSCENKCIGTNKPNCNDSQCVGGRMYSDAFTERTSNSQRLNQCTHWKQFRQSLVGSYSKVTLSGTFDPKGVSCTGPAAATLCKALHDGTEIENVVCDGNTWRVGQCGSDFEISTNPGGACYCSTTDFNVRPCGDDRGFGGVNTPSCNEAPSQTLNVICE